VYATYCLALLAMRSIWWTVRFVFWVILYATFGVTLFVAHSISWMICWVARFNQAANNIQSLRGGSTAAAIFHSAMNREAESLPAPRLRPSFRGVAISVRKASEALFAYERRVFASRSEIRETVARTLETIAQTQAFDAVSRGVAQLGVLRRRGGPL
jgi:hypothetical protein